jgi:RNA polymerase primary sigma factor
MCYGLGGEETLTLAEIGERLNLTRERVRQIRQAATDKLRRGDKCKVLRGYLG